MYMLSHSPAYCIEARLSFLSEYLHKIVKIHQVVKLGAHLPIICA